jgi:mannan endo-1,4-beta-mannosidase
MKSLFPLLLLSILAAYPAQGKKLSPADKKATKETINLFRSLYNLQNKGAMYGHQDDLM